MMLSEHPLHLEHANPESLECCSTRHHTRTYHMYPHVPDLSYTDRTPAMGSRKEIGPLSKLPARMSTCPTVTNSHDDITYMAQRATCSRPINAKRSEKNLAHYKHRASRPPENAPCSNMMLRCAVAQLQLRIGIEFAIKVPVMNTNTWRSPGFRQTARSLVERAA